MVLEIVKYGHPALRAKGRRIGEVDEVVRQLAQDMIDTMGDADGVGLAAQQVGMPLQLFVVDTSGVADRPSTLRIGGREVRPDEHMPMVLLNPEIEPLGKADSGTEGCLSFPGLLADIERPERVRVRATDLDGREVDFEAGGLLARAVQHEYDHLQGVLFIDRMSEGDRHRLKRDLEKLLAAQG